MYCRLLALVGGLLISNPALAQDFRSSAGLRLSWGGLATYKHKLDAKSAAEGIVAVRWGGVEITGLYERYFPAFGNEDFHWFAGGGFHMGFHGRNNVINPPEGTNKTIYLNPGADLIGGLEYEFPNLPFQASIDYKPSFHFTGVRWFVGESLGLSMRYCW